MPKMEMQMLEHVYHPENQPEEFRQVRIQYGADSVEEKLMVYLEPESPLSSMDLRNILSYLEKVSFRKSRICLKNDCVVIVQSNGSKTTVQDKDLICGCRLCMPPAVN